MSKISNELFGIWSPCGQVDNGTDGGECGQVARDGHVPVSNKDLTLLTSSLVEKGFGI